jgi:hypothetical protein
MLRSASPDQRSTYVEKTDVRFRNYIKLTRKCKIFLLNQTHDVIMMMMMADRSRRNYFRRSLILLYYYSMIRHRGVITLCMYVHCTETSRVFIRNLQVKKKKKRMYDRSLSRPVYFFIILLLLSGKSQFYNENPARGARYPVHEAWPEGVEEHCAFHLHWHYNAGEKISPLL